MVAWHERAQMQASRSYAVLIPNSRKSTGYEQEFQPLLQDDVDGGESRDLMAGASAKEELGIAVQERLGIAGLS